LSNPLAIAAVTSTLRTLIDRSLRDGTDVTALPLDRARSNKTGRQVNLFLYQVALNAAWRNMDMPRQTKAGETASPPLPLNLYYLLTVFPGDSEDDTGAHTLLGRVMSVLHDHPVLGRDEIQAALKGNDLYAQIERVRLSFQPLSSDDIFKVWSNFQTQYRLSAAYEATVVLIDSSLPSRTPLPVLTFGPEDQGPRAQANLMPPFPALDPEQKGLRDDQKGLRGDLVTGDTVTLLGFNLHSPGTARIRFRAARPPDPDDLDVLPGGTEEQVQFVIPDAMPAGFYTVAVVIRQPNAPEQTTNELPFALSPTITTINGTVPGANPLQVHLDPQGNVALRAECKPAVGSSQRVSLLFGDREVPADPRTGTSPVNRLRFVIPQPALGTYWLRLRVDGIDSPLIDYGQKHPVFKAPQVEVLA
jgi:hypothetical protein